MGEEPDVLYLQDVTTVKPHASRWARRIGKLHRCPSCRWFCQICSKNKKCCLQKDPYSGADTLHPDRGYQGAD